MRLRDHYDWVVLGEDPSALLSASLAAKLGLSVLILPLSEPMALKISSDEEVLDLESSFLLGLGEGGLLLKCLEHVGITDSERELIFQDPAGLQVLTPNARVSLRNDRVRFQNELEREFGKKQLAQTGLIGALCSADEPIASFWTGFPERLTLREGAKNRKRDASSFFTLKKLSDQLSRGTAKKSAASRLWFTRSKKVSRWAERGGYSDWVAWLEGASAGVSSSCTTSERTMFEVLHLLSLARSGASFRGGMSAFRELLFRLAQRNGADVPQKTICSRIFLQSGKITGILPSSRGSMIGVSGAIVGAPLDSIRPLLTVSGGSLFRRLKSPKKPVGWKFTLSLSLHPEAIPPGISHRMLWQEKGAPAIEIELIRPSDYKLKERKRALLFLRTTLPMTQESLDPGYQRLIAARLVRKLTGVLPFVEFHITRIYPDFRDPDVPELGEIYGFESLDQIPSQLFCYEGEGLKGNSGIEGLFVSSAESLPHLGEFGALAAALESVAWVAHRSGLSGPFKP